MQFKVLVEYMSNLKAVKYIISFLIVLILFYLPDFLTGMKNMTSITRFWALDLS